MPKIDKFTIDKLLDTAKIEEVIKECIGSYGPDNRSGLKKSGVRYKALCPFHDDKSMGSFIVYPKGNCYKCFSCGAKGGVIDFLMEHEKLSYPDALRWLGKFYSIPVDDVPVDWTYTPKPAPPPLKTLVLPKFLMTRTLTDAELDRDNLIRWIKTGIKWDTIQESRIKKVLADYCVGHGKNGHTIFWQMDEHGDLRTGKMMKYREDGHRDKVATWNFDWIHSTLSRHWDAEKHEMTDEPPYPYPHLYDPDKQEAQLTFFGMHLLNRYPHATVNIVESEKTAVLMAIAYGNHATQIWMACGGLEMLSAERLKPITSQGRQIVLFPDRDGVGKWRAKAKQLGYHNLIIDCMPVQKWWKPCDGEKADIADVVVRILNERKPMTSIDEVKATMPQTAPLIDKLSLKITQQ